MKIQLLFFTLLYSCAVFAQWKPDTIILKKPFNNITLKNPTVKKLNPYYNIRKINIQQGLPGAYVTCLTTDEKGYLWFGTYGGGCGKYNGKTFEIYTESSGLPSNYIQKIFQDSKKRIWVATYGKGIALKQGHSWKIYNDSTGFDGKYVWDICEDKKGNIWFAVERLGAVCFDGKAFKTFEPEDGLCSKNIRTVYCDKKGDLWFGSDGRGFSKYNGTSFQSWSSQDGLPDNRVVSILEWNDQLLIGTYGGGMCVFSNDSFRIISEKDGLANDLISSINTGKNKLLISTSGSGISVYDGKEFRNISTSNGLSNDIVISACEDVHGNIWVGTYGGGISCIMNDSFISYNEQSGLPVNVVKAVLGYEQGNWLAFSGGGLGYIKNDSLITYSEQNELPSPYILALAKTTNGSLWAGTSGAGIFKFTRNDLSGISNWNGLPGNYILSLFGSPDGKLWIGSYGNGLGYLLNDTVFWFKPDKTFHPEYVSNFCMAGDSLLVATDKGLYIYKNGSINEFLLPAAIGKNIRSLMTDGKGRLWLGTSGAGLWVKSGSDYIKMVNVSRVSADNIESVFMSENGSVFIGIWNGFIKLTPTDAFKQKLSLPVFLGYYVKNYNSENGFPGFNSLSNSFFADNNGHIFMGTGQCLAEFSQQPEPFNLSAPDAELFDIKRGFTEINWKELTDSGIVIVKDSSFISGLPVNPAFRYDCNNLTFCIRPVTLNYYDLCSISYRLKGFDDKFSPPVKDYNIKYSNLPPGEYCLEVYGINENGIWSNVPFSYSFSVLKPWWETWWFRILAVSVVLITLFTLYYIRISVLKKRQRILEQRIAEATQEIREKNSALEQQNEEIISQRDEIEAQRDEITSQRDILAQQKEQIEIIHEEQTSSIRYAQRIQQAMLPSLETIDSTGLDYYIFFRPRDIVSGDFYWVGRHENNLVVAVADCTGHGVPGAFMSMLGIAFLKEIIVKEYIIQPDIVLKRLRKEIIRSLKQEPGSNQRDGMDIALCTINLDTLELQFAGANNPLYIVKAEEKAEEVKREENLALASSLALIEVKGDKMPIGIHERMDAFTLHTHQLRKGDCIYMFSDGMADQFGGPDGKKFKYKQLKEILMANLKDPADVQKEKLEKYFMEWKGNLEQVDDVTVLGIKF